MKDILKNLLQFAIAFVTWAGIWTLGLCIYISVTGIRVVSFSAILIWGAISLALAYVVLWIVVECGARYG